jgi:hypothetical protein
MEATPVPFSLVVSFWDRTSEGAIATIETSTDECVKRLCEKIEHQLRLKPGQYLLYRSSRVVNKYEVVGQVVKDWVGIESPTLLYDTDALPKPFDLTCTVVSGRKVLVKANRRTHAIRVIHQIQSAMGLDPNRSLLRLLFGGTELYPYDRIGERGLLADATLEVVVSPTAEYPGWRKLALPISITFNLPDSTSASVKVTPGDLVEDLYDAIICEMEHWLASEQKTQLHACDVNSRHCYGIRYVLHNGRRLSADAANTVWGSKLLEDSTIDIRWICSKHDVAQCSGRRCPFEPERDVLSKSWRSRRAMPY